MKKSEILQIVFIVLGIGIIFKTLLSLFEQLTYFFQYFPEEPLDLKILLIVTGIVIILIVIGLILIIKAKLFSGKIIKNDADEKLNITLNKTDIIQISVVILSLYFIIIYSPGFISSISNIIFNFVEDFNMYKKMLPQNIWSVILYISIFLILINSKKFSIWLERKLF